MLNDISETTGFLYFVNFIGAGINYGSSIACDLCNPVFVIDL